MRKTRSSRGTRGLATPNLQSGKEVSGRQRKQEKETTSALDRKAKAILEESRRLMRDLVGRKAYDDLRAAIRSERQALRDLLQPPEGLKRDFWADRRALKKKIDALLRKHGVSADKVKRIQADTRQKLGEVMASDWGAGYSIAKQPHKFQELTGLDPNSVPTAALPPDDPNDPHRWFWFMPPYERASGWVLERGDLTDEDFIVTASQFNTTGGLVGSEMTCDNYDAGNGDSADPWTDNFVEVSIKMPIMGRLQAVIRAQCLRDFYDVSFTDEFGFSHAWAYQENSLYIQVIAPNFNPPRFGSVMSTNYTTGDDPPVMGEHLISGDYYYAYPTTKHTIGVGEYTLRVGATNIHRVFTDDMTARCRSIFLWNIVSVGVRIAY